MLLRFMPTHVEICHGGVIPMNHERVNRADLYVSKDALSDCEIIMTSEFKGHGTYFWVFGGV